MTPESATENVTDNDMLNFICVSFVFVDDRFFEKVTFTLSIIMSALLMSSSPVVQLQGFNRVAATEKQKSHEEGKLPPYYTCTVS